MEPPLIFVCGYWHGQQSVLLRVRDIFTACPTKDRELNVRVGKALGLSRGGALNYRCDYSPDEGEQLTWFFSAADLSNSQLQKVFRAFCSRLEPSYACIFEESHMPSPWEWSTHRPLENTPFYIDGRGHSQGWLKKSSEPNALASLDEHVASLLAGPLIRARYRISPFWYTGYEGD